jgi:hypothetical protein
MRHYGMQRGFCFSSGIQRHSQQQ